MMRTNDTPQTSRPSAPLARPMPIEAQFNPLLITFLLKTKGREVQVRCRGCQEIVPLTQRPSNCIRGVIELDGRLVPVIDASARLGAEKTPIGNCSCIVVVEHDGISERHCTDIIVHDIDEVMQLAAGAFHPTVETEIRVNMQFVIETCNSPGPPRCVAEAHRNLCYQ